MPGAMLVLRQATSAVPTARNPMGRLYFDGTIASLIHVSNDGSKTTLTVLISYDPKPGSVTSVGRVEQFLHNTIHLTIWWAHIEHLGPREGLA